MKGKIVLATLLSCSLVGVAFAGFLYGDGDNLADNSVTPVIDNITFSKVMNTTVSLAEGDKLVLDGAKGDVSGRVTTTGEGEDLSITINITVSGTKTVFEYAEINANDINGVITNKYLKLSDESKSIPVSEFKLEQDGDINTYNITKELKFVWSEKFNSMNPSLYFDEDETGKSLSLKEVSDELNSFKAAVDNTELTLSVVTR